uniref:Calcium homeostasis modulator 3 n=1 Tax=Haplochromis burtoni TaxID=8153 RepID=A0A3Q2VBU8_HAPBU
SAALRRLKLVLQYFQSNSESISNGICIILALVSVKLYTSFDFNCPCLPQYNKLYSLGVMIVPPIILFFLGILVNRHTGVMMDEWMRPIGNRSKNPAVVKYLFSAMIQRALLAPMVWILVTLLDGKIFICAFSVSVDPALFSGKHILTTIMAKVPCKEDVIFRNSSFRKAVSRYVRCHSQVSSQPHKQCERLLISFCWLCEGTATCQGVQEQLTKMYTGNCQFNLFIQRQITTTGASRCFIL